MIIVKIFHSVVEWLLRGIGGGLGQRLRRAYYSRRMRHCGKGVKIGVGVQFVGVEYISLGEDVWLDDYVVLIAGMPISFSDKTVIQRDNPEFDEPAGTLTIGACTHIAPFVMINVFGAGGKIGPHCGMSSGAKLYATSNHFYDKHNPKRVIGQSPMSKSLPIVLISSPVTFGENVFVSINSVILSCAIGKYSFVRPNTVVARDMPANGVIGGDPAEVQGKRFPGIDV